MLILMMKNGMGEHGNKCPNNFQFTNLQFSNNLQFVIRRTD